MESVFELGKKKCVCPNCGAEMSLSEEHPEKIYVCNDCGCTIKAEEQNFDSMNCCPNCNQPLEDNECTYCGYYLGSDFE